MNRTMVRTVAGTVLALCVAQAAYATNGDSLEGIGGVSEAMGGVGVAAPQCGLTAIVNNPAGLSLVPGAENPALTAGLTLFQPTVSAKITTPGGTVSGDSDDPLSLIPFFSYSQALNDKMQVGFGAYGVSGMGVDYRGNQWDLDGNPANGYEGDLFTQFSSMKLAPAVSYKLNENLSLGAALHGNYSTLDLDFGKAEALSAGIQLGMLYRMGSVQVGASYTTPQKSTFEEVYNFDAFSGDLQQDDLTLEQPAVYAGGVAWQPTDKLLLEANAKYLTWGDSEGYDAFDWENQWVFAVGAQFKATEKLSLRAGFNYAANPVKEHNGWNPEGLTEVQGKQVPTFGYEMLRNVGFPAIVESHLTVGFGYQLTEALSLNVAYAHVLEEEIQSRSMGDAIQLESTLSEDSLGIGLAWAFQ